MASQGLKIDGETLSRADAAHAGHFAGTRNAVTDRADLAESLEPFPGSLSQNLDIHLLLPSSIRANRSILVQTLPGRASASAVHALPCRAVSPTWACSTDRSPPEATPRRAD